jgi:glutamate dehydrogenase
MHKLLDKNGIPKFKIIVEGANTFITQEARRFLESKGVVLIKDSSANKGGVISSSHEVLVALVLNETEFAANMTWNEGEQAKEFYKLYVQEVQERIETVARYFRRHAY